VDLILAKALNRLSIQSLLITVEFGEIQMHSGKFTHMCPKSSSQETYSAAVMGTGN